MLKDASGSVLTPESPTSVYVYGGTFDGSYSPEQLTAAIADVRLTGLTDPSSAASKLQTIFNGFDQWGVISPATGGGAVLFDWVSTISGTPGGNKVYMIVVTNSIDSIVSSTQVGIVSVMDVLFPELGTDNIGFISGTTEALRWNQFFMGSSGSLTLEAIPEPRVYAGVFGLCVLAVAWMRRRRA